MKQTTIQPEFQFSIFDGPTGAYGFRSGRWPFTYRGKQHTVYLSVSHYAPLPEQETLVRRAILNEISRINAA